MLWVITVSSRGEATHLPRISGAAAASEPRTINMLTGSHHSPQPTSTFRGQVTVYCAHCRDINLLMKGGRWGWWEDWERFITLLICHWFTKIINIKLTFFNLIFIFLRWQRTRIYFGFHLLIDACILADSLFVDSEYIRVTIIIKSKSDDQGKVSDARPT